MPEGQRYLPPRAFALFTSEVFFLLNNGSVLGPLLLQGFLIFLNAVFACAEIAVISSNDKRLSKLAATGDRRAVRIIRLTTEPGRFLATIQVGITLVNLLGSAFAAQNFASRLTAALINAGVRMSVSALNSASVILITLILTYLTVTLGELIPKQLGIRGAEKLALSMSGFIYAISKLFAPAVWLLNASANGFLRLFGVNPNERRDEDTEEEIRMMADAGMEKGTINPDEKDMIANIFEFNDISAGEIMTHRTEVSLLWTDETDGEWEKTISESRHSIYPVCAESPDNVVGLLYAKDYFRLRDRSRESVMENAVHPAVFVPEAVRADVLFRNMKKSRNHFAVVLDEYGGMSGIITVNDLLEELVGEFDDGDEKDAEPLPIERIDSRTWRISGSAELEDVSTELGVPLPEEDYETFGGMVFGILGTIPPDGSTPELEEFGLTIRVTKIEEHRLLSAVVYVNKKEEKEERE